MEALPFINSKCADAAEKVCQAKAHRRRPREILPLPHSAAAKKGSEQEDMRRRGSPKLGQQQ